MTFEGSKKISSVTQSCPALCDPMNCSTPGVPVHHQLREFTQTHVHWVGDAIQPSYPLLSPSPPAFNPSQHQGLFKWVNSSNQVAKVLEFQLQHQSFQWIYPSLYTREIFLKIGVLRNGNSWSLNTLNHKSDDESLRDIREKIFFMGFKTKYEYLHHLLPLSRINLFLSFSETYIQIQKIFSFSNKSNSLNLSRFLFTHVFIISHEKK